MSSKNQKRRDKSYYPTEWTEWELDEVNDRWQRCRLSARDTYEYDYDDVASPSQPRGQSALMSIPAAGHYSQQGNYTTASYVDEMTAAFSRSALVPVPDARSQSQISMTPSFASNSGHNLHGSSYNAIPLTFSSSSQYASSRINGLGGSYAPSTQNQSGFRSSSPIIRSSNPKHTKERGDANYRVYPTQEFKRGKVFKILWTEPSGQTENGYSSDSHSTVATVTHQGDSHSNPSYYQKIRRFVVINPMEGHCICLPINTYGQRGVLKNGVKPSHHTIIYTTDKPEALKGEVERGLTKVPLKMKPVNIRHRLHYASRLNYAKPYTVEYNVKVYFIGRLHESSLWHMESDYMNVHPPLEHHGIPPPGTSSSNHELSHVGGHTAESQLDPVGGTIFEAEDESHDDLYRAD